MSFFYLYLVIGTLSAILILPIVSAISLQYARLSTVPSDIPWAGLKNKTIFPRLRACLREVLAKRDPFTEGYEKYGKHGKPFVLPAMHWPEVALPPSNLTWLAAQPENVVSNLAVQDDLLALRYLAHGPDLDAVTDFSVLRKDLTRNLGRVLPDVIDEMRLSFSEELSSVGEEWTESKIFKTIVDTSRRLNNRLFVGAPLCRDKRYISGLEHWEVAFAVASAVIRYCTPDLVKPWIAPIFAMPVRAFSWRLKRMLFPIMRQRIAARAQVSDEKLAAENPSDVLQWLLNAKLDGRDTTGMSMSDIASKTILLNFFSVATVSINASSVLTNILCSPSASSLISELRTEADNIMPKLPSDPKSIREMRKLDSVIRESLRLTTMGAHGLIREVIAPQGVTTPDGLYLPQGTHVSVILNSYQTDPDIWERGNEFVPFRFYRSDHGKDEANSQAKHAVHVTTDFLSFGYGPHACPGRFFAVQALKIILGHLLTTYDFEPLTERPKCLEFGSVVVPSDKATVRIRKRQSNPI